MAEREQAALRLMLYGFGGGAVVGTLLGASYGSRVAHSAIATRTRRATSFIDDVGESFGTISHYSTIGLAIGASVGITLPIPILLGVMSICVVAHARH